MLIQQGDSRYNDEMVIFELTLCWSSVGISHLSYIYNGNSYTRKMISPYWIGTEDINYEHTVVCVLFGLNAKKYMELCDLLFHTLRAAS